MPDENEYQAKLIRKLRNIYPEAIILKNDANYLQGIPDTLILFEDRWAMLETKKASGSSRRPNQKYYIDKLNDMSFARFIYPGNEEEVLNELQDSFRA